MARCARARLAPDNTLDSTRGLLKPAGMFKPSLLLLGLALLTPAFAQTPAERLLQEKRPLVIGHRGFCAAAPENTLPAFKLALAAGADLVELDYHHTKDNELVVIHDFTLDRTTSATNQWSRNNLRVADHSLAQLRGLDAGAWFNPAFAGTKLLRLDEALDVIQAGGVTLIERKAGPAKDCVELIRKKSLLNRVVVQSFDWEYLADYHQLEPTQALGGLGPWGSYRGEKLSDEDKWLSPRWVDEAEKIGVRAVVWNRQVRPEAVRHAHAKGLRIWVYTINDAAVANDLLNLGVDGLITDNPAQMWRTLALRTAR
jgi:glycerophosphoryl diester phosphodiesterase